MVRAPLLIMYIGGGVSNVYGYPRDLALLCVE